MSTSLRDEIFALENEVWVSLSDNKSTTKYTRHDPAKIDQKRSGVYYRDDCVVALQNCNPMPTHKAFMDMCDKGNVFTSYKIDESSIEVRPLAGSPGHELAAVITYKVSVSTKQGSDGYWRMTTWSKGSEGKWMAVAHMGYNDPPISSDHWRQLHMQQSE
eukprot:TRINITY_DN8625_c0_g1_i2.p1 TRINITY_DN8625_c0_g1~~TRINITY_DN8625_c0_g1_i2.p1  ORF type:complete len:187 (-),score=47.23 TRINITY_DN8625_c0_g1_i2:42-521(-)